MANEFLDNPIIQRSPKSQKEWIDFIFALSGFIATKGELGDDAFTQVLSSDTGAQEAADEAKAIALNAQADATAARNEAEGTTDNLKGWRDITGQIQVRVTGGGRPTWRAIGGGDFWAYEFGIGEECWIYFHVPHDFDIENPEVYIHAHWVNDGSDTDEVKWTFEWTHALGFGQEAFAFGGGTTISTADETADGTPYTHYITETAAIDMGITEPDGLIALRIERANADSGNDLGDNTFLLMCDIHYQSTSAATPNKEPNFYG